MWGLQGLYLEDDGLLDAVLESEKTRKAFVGLLEYNFVGLLEYD